MNAKEYRKHVGVSKTKYVLDWIDKGYLPNVKNSETGAIDIPSDMPRPYKSNGKTQKISKLIEEIIKAADSQQSIYPQMFPLIREKTFERTIESMVECQIISKQYSSTGTVYYELLPSWKSCDPTDQKKVFETVGDAISTGASVMQIIQTVVTLIPTIQLTISRPVPCPACHDR